MCTECVHLRTKTYDPVLPEVLTKPLHADPRSEEVAALTGLLSRLDLRAFDEPTARLSVALSTIYGLRAADGAHLATAVSAGADVFLTDNRKDFSRDISEIDVVYPHDL
ncbi:type II toxin-antitoxin system VapC family toxin [Microbacterium elymi]|uniref:PIN domain-containing protein n=1 Tax=Microbacterium elymi TaxID=2909587 RepID=A0ABY5NLG4_9MICO|nr:PIN domain-containing protein [Microbacterium elymi]UUT36000.1 PIN domain-containing protein [Microbacterium elymi]